MQWGRHPDPPRERSWSLGRAPTFLAPEGAADWPGAAQATDAARRAVLAVRAMDVPLFRALVVPMVMGLLFSLLSLGVGVDLPARVRGWLPHRTHVVAPGETLSQIAARYGMPSWETLYRAGANARRHPDPDRIREGARLDLPYRALLAPGLRLGTLAQLSAPVCGVVETLPTRAATWAARLCDGGARATEGA